MIELSSNEKLDLLLKWMNHVEIPRIAAKYRFNAMDAIKQYKELGILLYEPNKTYLTFDEYCKNAHFLKIVAR